MIDAEELEALRRAEELYRLTIENISDAIFVTDDAGRFGYVCPNCHVIFGWSSDEVREMSDLTELLGANVIDGTQLNLHGEIANRCLEVVIRGGETRVVLVNVKRVAIVGGTVLIAVRDITEREMLERRVARSRRMEAIDRFSRGVAHDLNNLLGVIATFAGTILERARLTSEAEAIESDIVEIQHAVRDGTTLANDLGAFVRDEVVPDGPISPSEVLVASSKVLISVAVPCSFGARIPESLPDVRMDRTALQRVMVNLVLNAREAMGDEGTITVTAEDVTTTAKKSMACAEQMPPGRYVMIRCVDDGPGMAPDTLERIFEPYFTTKDRANGGIGLASCLGLVRRAKGFAEATSTLGEGTVVSIYLPALA